MTDSELIKLAKQVGFNREDHHAIMAMLLDFGQAAVEAERLECAKLASFVGMMYYHSEGEDAVNEVVKAIKARNKLL